MWPIGTTWSLCKRVCPYQWNLWVKLTTADWVHSSCFSALNGYKGVWSHSPFLQCCPGGMNDTSSRKFLRVQMLTSSSVLTFPECSGKLEDWMLRLCLKHSLDRLLHWTRAIRGTCCSLHKARFPHPIPSSTALESYYSWGCLPTCPLKKQQTLCWGFCWTKMKNYLLACSASTEIKRLCQQCHAGYRRVAVRDVAIYAEENFFGDKAHELDSQLLLSA